MADETTQRTKRKRSNKGNKHRKKAKPNNTHHKRKKNWIESCTESVHRIPSNCVAPICCVVTRSELVEDRLLPGVRVSDEHKQEDDTVKTGVQAVIDDGNGGYEQVADKCGVANELDHIEQGSSKEQISVNSSVVVRNDAGKKASSSLDTEASGINPTQSVEPSNTATLKTANTSDASFKVSDAVSVNGEEKKVFISVKRHSSTVGPTQWQLQKKQKRPHQQYRHLPNGDNGDGITNPYPKHLVPDKFWAQRKRLFSKYHEGIQIEHGEMWYSVTPEVIANHIAGRMVEMVQQGCNELNGTCVTKEREIVVLDVFCGCGGNAIAFARKNRVKVFAVDNDLTRLKMAANNARVYGLNEQEIIFVHADAVDVLRSFKKGSRCAGEANGHLSSTANQLASGYRLGGLELLPDRIDSVFLSPPWGGMNYDSNDTFDPISCITIESKHDDGNRTIKNGGELFQMSANAVFSSTNGALVYFLPRNIDGIALGQIAISSNIEHEWFEMEQNVVNGKVKTVTAYFGHGLRQRIS